MADQFSKEISLPAIAATIFVVALAAIVTAHGFEHLGGYNPCPLCLTQRYAYYVGIPLAALSFFLARAQRHGLAAILLLLCGLGFLANTGLGIYHSGVEWKWWPGPASCAGGDLTPISGDLLQALEGARAPACDEAPWRFLGLSFAGWNAVVSLCIALTAILAIRASGPNRPA
ncbi:MAG: disulfide bond formation protein B [Hyphomicrobiaceae bacterium]|nr:disulfide bond formation protein B [Hyphomicrobiaceae bacterium]